MTTNNERERELSISAQREFLKRNPLAKVRLSDVTADSSVWQNRIRDFVDGAEFAETALRAEYETKLAEAQANGRGHLEYIDAYLESSVEDDLKLPLEVVVEKMREYISSALSMQDTSALDAITAPLEARNAELEEALRKAVDTTYSDSLFAEWNLLLANKSPAESLERVKIRAKVEAFKEAADAIEKTVWKTISIRSVCLRLRRMADELKAKL